ncbi:PREDICTED: protocadherin gamma-A9-like, partial [Corvus brachyrhynchos]|uniref:protocadherin gamma-A9-like n=1 Tax=Corvus brachyrhynchos TaxID=85066 RepID=UPI000816399A
RRPETPMHEIGEWTLPGARFPLETARDADAGSNSLLTYQLTSNPSFSLALNENPGGKRQPELVLERALDREKQSSFELVLMAVDGGDPARSGTVQATDADVGPNGRVSYSFGNVPDDVPLFFVVDSERGEIRTAGLLDFEEKNKYIFGMEARDGGGLTGHCEVQIDITDENDNVPEVTVLSLSSPVPEDAPTGTVVALLKVRDRDSGENGQVSCELSGEAPLSIVPSSGGSEIGWRKAEAGMMSPWRMYRPRELPVNKAGRQRSAALGACSAGRRLRAPLLTERSERKLGKLPAAPPAADRLDRLFPVRLGGGRSASVPAAAGGEVGSVAKDLGLQLRDRGVHIVERGRTQYFSLHGKTGHLVTAERIDREQLCESVQQCVLRCELVVEGEMKFYEIEVEITDINDNAPSFREPEIELRMSETTAPGTRFPLARAHDPDMGRNSLQSYELSGDEHFSLAVQGTARIRVTVVDANDNAPVFSQAEYTVRVPEDVPVGSVLVSLTATDADEGLNGHVKYSYQTVSVKASTIFHLDAETGVITLMRNLDFEEGNSYELEVQVRDGGDLSDIAKVVITVTDVNDN